MSDLLFKCPKCAKHLVVDGSASGEILKCLACGQPIQVPRSDNQFKCPSCAWDLCAPPNVTGKWFHCPNCQKTLSVPSSPTTRIPVQRNDDWNTPSGASAD